MKKSVKIITTSVFLTIFVTSISFNIYWINRSFKLKASNKDIVDNIVEPIIIEIINQNEKLNDTYVENVTTIKDNFKDKTTPLIKDKTTADGNKVIITKIDGEVIETILSNDILESQRQTIFFNNQLNEVIRMYEIEIDEKNKLINDLVVKLKTASSDITNDITKNELNTELARFQKSFFRLGIDFGTNFNANDVIMLNFKPTSVNLGLNCLIINKINVRAGVGLGINENPNTATVSLGYYF